MRFRAWSAVVAAFVLFPSVVAAQYVPPAAPPVPAPSAAAPYAPQPGMQFEGTLTQSISSRDAWVGEQIALANVNSTDQTITGARMFGRVVEVVHAGQGRNAEVLLRFDTLQLPSGALYPVIGEVTHVDVKTNNNGGKEALGALGGMIVGNILGKWFGTNAGGFLGAAGGYLVAKNNREDVTIPQNSGVSVRLVPPHPQEQQYAPPAAYPQRSPLPSYAQPPMPTVTPPSAPSPPPAPPQPAPQQPQRPPGPAPTPQPD